MRQDYNLTERHRGYYLQPKRPPFVHLPIDRASAHLPDVPTVVLSKLPRVASKGPYTTLHRWARLQEPPLDWASSLRLWHEERIPSAYRYGRHIIIPLDAQVIDERGLLAAVRSVVVLPPKQASERRPGP